MYRLFLFHPYSANRHKKKRSLCKGALYRIVMYNDYSKPNEAFTANTFSSAAAFTASYSAAPAKGNFTSM